MSTQRIVTVLAGLLLVASVAAAGESPDLPNEAAAQFFGDLDPKLPQSIVGQMRQRVVMAIEAGGTARLDPESHPMGPRLFVDGIGAESELEPVGDQPVKRLVLTRGPGHLYCSEGGFLSRSGGSEVALGPWYGRRHEIKAKANGDGFLHRIEIFLPAWQGPAIACWSNWLTSVLGLDAAGRVRDAAHYHAHPAPKANGLGRLVAAMDPLMKQLAQHITVEAEGATVVLGRVKPEGRFGRRRFRRPINRAGRRAGNPMKWRSPGP